MNLIEEAEARAKRLPDDARQLYEGFREGGDRRLGRGFGRASRGNYNGNEEEQRPEHGREKRPWSHIAADS
jgi:hypothetical protein